MKKLMKNNTGRLLIGIVALAVAIAVCAVVPKLTADCTPTKVATPAPEAKALLAALDEPVTLTLITGAEDGDDLWLAELTARYGKLGKNLTVNSVDYNSGAMDKLLGQTHGAALMPGDVVIASDKRCAVVAHDDMYQYELDMNAYYYYGQTVYTSVDYAAQQEICRAIEYVTSSDLPTVYLVSGHGEAVDNPVLYDLCREYNVDLKTLALTEDVPEDAALVMIASPAAPMTADETGRLDAWLKQGGHLIVMTGSESVTDGLDALLADYGMAQEKGIILESDSKHAVVASGQAYAHMLKPDLRAGDLTQSLIDGGLNPVVSVAAPLTRSDVRRAGLNAAVLMTTSDTSYCKRNIDQLTTLDREDADDIGPFVLAMQAVDGNARVTWFACASMFDETGVAASNGANAELFRLLLAGETELTEGMTVAPSGLMSGTLTLPAAPALIGMLVLPLLAVVWAIVNKKKRG